MANIADVKARLKAGALARFGQKAFVNGFEYDVIFFDGEFEDEQGVRQEITISVDRDIVKYLKKDDKVLVDDRCFTIFRIPKTDEVLVAVELNRE